MRTLLLASLFIALPVASGGIKVSNLTQYWTESGINLSMLRDQISNEKCASNEEYLKACREAVSTFKRYVPVEISWPENDFDSFLAAMENYDYSQSRFPRQQVWGSMYNSFLHVFDAHGNLIPLSAFNAFLKENYEARYGTGLRFVFTKAGAIVRDVIRSSPAARQGLRANDKIISVNGKALGTGLAAYQNRDLVSGQPGEVLKLIVERNSRLISVHLKIGVISERNVQSQVLSHGKNQFLVVRLIEFKGSSCEDLKSEMQRVKQKYHGIILDLRDNLGGVFDESVCISSLFVGREKIVGQRRVETKIPINIGYRTKPHDGMEWSVGKADAVFGRVPLVILINSASSSASEIVAGSLQDHKAAWVVGERSFGKGSVQNVEDFIEHDGFKIIYTSALFYRPSGATNQLVGVTPNFTVPARPNRPALEGEFLREKDIYVNSLQPGKEVMTEWTETRPEVVELRRCAEGALTRKDYADYQLAFSLALNSCVVKSQAKLSQHNR